MRTVGLTGGIATGKSTVSAMLRELGAIIADADALAKKAVDPGMPAYKDALKRFGHDILAPDATIDRERLGHIIFNDESARKDLNSIVHPRVFEMISAEIKKAKDGGASVLILDVPLLYETRMDSWIDPVMLVYADPKTQLKRLMLRDKCDEERAMARIKSQMPIDDKKAKAKIVIDNSGPFELLRGKVEEVWKALNALH